MDTDAARRARRKAIKADLAEAYTDEEATPPEWVDLLAVVRERSAAIRDDVPREVRAFVEEPDIRRALARRERFASGTRERVREVNKVVGRLNMLAPHARFTRPALDADELLRPLYRTPRSSGSGARSGG